MAYDASGMPVGDGQQPLESDSPTNEPTPMQSVADVTSDAENAPPAIAPSAIPLTEPKPAISSAPLQTGEALELNLQPLEPANGGTISQRIMVTQEPETETLPELRSELEPEPETLVESNEPIGFAKVEPTPQDAPREVQQPRILAGEPSSPSLGAAPNPPLSENETPSPLAVEEPSTLDVPLELNPSAVGEELSPLTPSDNAAPIAISPFAQQPEATEESTASESLMELEPSPMPEQAVVRQLPQGMTPIRDRLRSIVAANRSRVFSTSENTPDQIIQLCLAYGVEANIRHPRAVTLSNGGRTTQTANVNAIGALSWNFACRGVELMRPSADGRYFVPRVGLNGQSRPGEFLAMLALAEVGPDYEVRCGNYQGAVANIVAYEKATCFEGDDLSFKLIALSQYASPTEAWTNQLGEAWSLERMVEQELARDVPRGDRRVTDQLLGLAMAVDCWRQAGLPLQGALARAEKYLQEYHAFALSIQNDDGSWNQAFFAAQGKTSDLNASLASNAQIVRWLVASVSPEELEDPRVVRSVAHLMELLAKKSTRASTASMSRRELESVMSAAHALSLYDQRYFAQFAEPAPATASVAPAASRTSSMPIPRQY